MHHKLSLSQTAAAGRGPLQDEEAAGLTRPSQLSGTSIRNMWSPNAGLEFTEQNKHLHERSPIASAAMIIAKEGHGYHLVISPRRGSVCLGGGGSSVRSELGPIEPARGSESTNRTRTAADRHDRKSTIHRDHVRLFGRDTTRRPGRDGGPVSLICSKSPSPSFEFEGLRAT